jgi:aquaporin rerated protein, other eukaryote
VGPSVGAVVCVGFYKFIKMLEYEMANPGQDETTEEDAAAAAAEATPKKKPSKEGVSGDTPPGKESV